jgi:hypothetical protein
MRLFGWLWGVIKGIFTKKPEPVQVPTMVEQQEDPMECLENFIEVSLTV